MERKPWSQSEDFALKDLVQQIGLSNWTLVALRLSQRCPDSQRAGKQCRQRWLNHLDLKISKKPWTKSEENNIFQLHNRFGNKWREIANHLKARTENDIKNHFYASLRKGFRRLNKTIGFKLEPSKVRKIKPYILSKIAQANSNPQNSQILKQDCYINARVFNLVLTLSKIQNSQLQSDDVISDDQLMKQSQKFLKSVIKQNQLYDQKKMKKRQQAKRKQLPLRQVQSQIPDPGIDISQYLCLKIDFEEIDQLKPKSEGTHRKSEQLHQVSNSQLSQQSAQYRSNS